MIAGLLWILGSYGLAALGVHLYRLRVGRGVPKCAHYVLVTKNNQHQIEWYVRSLVWLAWIRGWSLRISVFDDSSTDETPAIVSRLARTWGFLRLTSYDGSAPDDCRDARSMWVDLRKSDRLARLPALQ